MSTTTTTTTTASESDSEGVSGVLHWREDRGIYAATTSSDASDAQAPGRERAHATPEAPVVWGASPTQASNVRGDAPPGSVPHGFPIPVPTLSHWQTEYAQSEMHDWLHGESLMLDNGEEDAVDTVIIGAGISGSLAAAYLLSGEDPQLGTPLAAAQGCTPAQEPRRSPSVVLLEARSACSGATGRNGGHCRPDSFAGYVHYSSLFGPEQAHAILRNERETFELMRSWMREDEALGGESQWWDGRTFGVYLSQAMLDRAKRSFRAYQEAGYLRVGSGEGEVEMVDDPDEAKKLTRVAEAVGCGGFQAGSLYPLRFVHEVLRRSVANGLRLYTHTMVDSLERLESGHPDQASSSRRGYRWRVRTSRGSIKAKQVLLATNGYSAALLPNLNEFITPHRAQCSAIKPPGTFGGSNAVPAPVDATGARLERTYSIGRSATDYEYLTQRPASSGGWFILGGGHEYGSKAEQIGTFDDGSVIQGITQHLAAYPSQTFKGWEAQGDAKHSRVGLHQLWTGIQGYTRDSVPLVGEVPEALLADGVSNSGQDRNGRQELNEGRGLFLDVGHHGHGMARAATCSRGVARLMSRDLGLESGPGKHITEGEEAWERFTGLPRCFRWTEARAARRDYADCRGHF